MKKFTRSNDNKIISGVFGGLGEYYQTDPLIYRLIGLFLLFLSGIIPLILVYIIAIFIVPKEGEEYEKSNKRQKFFLWLVLIIIIVVIVIPITIMLLGFSLFKVSSSYQVSEYYSPRHNQGESVVVYQEVNNNYKVIEDYLNNNIIEASLEAKVFSHHHVIYKTDDNIYLWAYISKYYLDGIDLKTKTAISLPVALNYINGEIISHQAPTTGRYIENLNNYFPDHLHDKIINFPNNREIIEGLKNNTEYKAINYYGI